MSSQDNQVPLTVPESSNALTSVPQTVPSEADFVSRFRQSCSEQSRIVQDLLQAARELDNHLKSRETDRPSSCDTILPKDTMLSRYQSMLDEYADQLTRTPGAMTHKSVMCGVGDTVKSARTVFDPLFNKQEWERCSGNDHVSAESLFIDVKSKLDSIEASSAHMNRMVTDNHRYCRCEDRSSTVTVTTMFVPTYVNTIYGWLHTGEAMINVCTITPIVVAQTNFEPGHISEEESDAE